MKLIQVCTLITPDGAYGGPVRVAVNQTRALLDAGHEVTLVAGAHGYQGNLPLVYDGVPVKLFRARQVVPGAGFSGLWAKGLLRHIKELSQTSEAIHIHLGRDMTTLPVAQWARKNSIPYVVQTHGMITKTKNPIAPALDALWTRPVLRSAKNVFYLTDKERAGLDEVVESPLNYRKLENGVPRAQRSDSSKEPRPEVLFLARLQHRKRPRAFIDMARALSPEFPAATFRLVGPDEGEGPGCRKSIQDSGLGDALKWEGPIAPHEALDRLKSASVYVLPSVDEPFPMSVLEAMSLGKPVVVTESCGLAQSIQDAGAGVVVDNTIENLSDAVRHILSDENVRVQMGISAYRLAHEKYGMQGVLRELHSAYSDASRHSQGMAF